MQTREGGLYLKKKLINLGILGIKLCQYLYTRKDIISEEVKLILEDTLSNNVIHTELDTLKMLSYDENKYINQIKSIEMDILGSGSLAQVHKCHLNNDSSKE